MPRGSSPKRERQYRHIRDAEKERGASQDEAEEIAARTVNKARARSGEAATSSRLSRQRHLVAAAGGPPSDPRWLGSNAEPALRGGQGPQRSRSFEDEQGAARASTGSEVTACSIT